MTSLQKFAAFILNHQLDNISSFYLSRARETKLPLLSLFEHLTEAQLHEVVKQNFTQLLDSMVAGKAYEHALQSIALWVEDKFPGVKSDDPGLHDLVQIISIRKYSFIKVLPAFTQDLEVYTEIILEMNAYYDFFREEAYEAYIHIQHQKLQKEKAFTDLVIDTTTEGIAALDTEFRVILWNKALVERTGVKKEDVLGKHVFDFFPENKTNVELEALQKAQQGERIYIENVPLKSREGFYEMNVVPLKDHTDEIIGSLTVSRDVTQR